MDSAKTEHKQAPAVKASELDFFLTRERLGKHLGFAIYGFVLLLLYIANAHYAEKIVVRSAQINREIKEKRSEYISIKKDLMSNSKLSEVSKRLEGTGLKPLGVPPHKLLRN